MTAKHVECWGYERASGDVRCCQQNGPTVATLTNGSPRMRFYNFHSTDSGSSIAVELTKPLLSARGTNHLRHGLGFLRRGGD